MFNSSLQNITIVFLKSGSNNHYQSLFICMGLVLLELKKKCTRPSSRSFSRLALPLLLTSLPFTPSLLCCCLSFYTFPLGFPGPCSVGPHDVLCKASNQHQQPVWAELELSRSKATQQREIDGLCSRMRSASLHFVCV